jgi:hypothetical protein
LLERFFLSLDLIMNTKGSHLNCLKKLKPSAFREGVRVYRSFVLFSLGFALLFVLAPPLHAQASTEQASSKQPPSEEDPAEDQPDQPDWYLRGHVDLRYTSRWNDDDEDQDLYEYLSLSFGQTGNRKISGYISGRLSHDLDGREHPDSFASTADTHDRLYARLTAAYVDVRFEKLLETARFGRQWLSEVPEVVRVDGLRLKTRPLEASFNTRLVLFGGVPEHYDESSRDGDGVFGGGFEFKPLKTTRVSLFYARIKDEYKAKIATTGAKNTFSDDLVTVELRQLFFSGTTSFYGLYTNLNGSSRESKTRLTYVAKDGRTNVGVNYRTLLSTQSTLSTELDPYVSILRDYHPYHEVSADLTREFTDRLGAQAGTQVRRLAQESDKGAFNHEFERYYLSGILNKWPVKESLITLTGELYDADGDRFWVAEGSYEHELLTELKLKVGSGYSLYNEDRFTFEERTHVRSGFIGVEYDPGHNLKFMLEYAAERDDFDTTHRVEATVRYRF